LSDRELKSGCKGNSGWNDRDLELKSIFKYRQNGESQNGEIKNSIRQADFWPVFLISPIWELETGNFFL
jgi:hypothetical protein